MNTDIERIVRTRLRGLRTSMGLSLDELAARSHLSASTISRIETGNRTISLDVLVTLSDALQTDIATLLEVTEDRDVVIRPVPSESEGQTIWMLNRSNGPGDAVAVKMRLEPTDAPGEQRVHPGHDWFFVLSGAVRLFLADREVIVNAGEAAEFSTMTPHSFQAHGGGVAEFIAIFSRDGHHAHQHTPSGH